MPATDHIATDRLVLRRPGAGDLESILRIHGDPQLNRHNPSGAMRGPGEAREMLARWDTWWRRDGIGYWAVALAAAPERVIGFGGVIATGWRDLRVANLYYRFSPEAQGRGYALEMARAAIACAADALPGLPVIVRTRHGNADAVRLAERAGLTRRPDLDTDGFAVLGTGLPPRGTSNDERRPGAERRS